MKNKKMYPFERNNYFYGKLLSVRDFSDEQKYNNDKRRLDNILTNGCGVISGLTVVFIDDKTISVESGLAIDSKGREIIVDQGITKKLNIIDGFDEIEDFDNVYLCIDYDEKKEETVHSIATDSDDEESIQYNRIKEGYRLFLTDKIGNKKYSTIEEMFKKTIFIYSSDDLTITQTFPAYIKKGEYFETEVEIEKTNLPRTISVDYTLSTDMFKNENGENTLRVFCTDDDILAYKKIKTSYILKADESFTGISKINFVAGEGSVVIGSQNYDIYCKDFADIRVTDNDINDFIVREYIQKNFNNVVEEISNESICLAKLRIIKRNEEYIIDYCENLPFSQYVVGNEMLYALMNRNKFSEKVNSDVVYVKEENSDVPEGKVDNGFSFSCGTETIEIEPRSKNKSYFSDEISHGLGTGDVYISCALAENIGDDNFYDVKKTFMGNADVFFDSIYESELPPFDTGIISYVEKGTFKIGVKFWDDAGKTSVDVKWWAFKSDKGRSRDVSEMNGVSVMISPDTVTVHPRECIKFEADILGTDVKECKWSVVESDGGKIDINGVYEAPTKEGVYEVTVQSVAYPNKKASAFVVVKE